MNENENNNMPATFEIQQVAIERWLEFLETKWSRLYQEYELCDLWFHLALEFAVKPALPTMVLDIDNTDDINQTSILKQIIKQVVKFIMQTISTWYTKNDSNFIRFNRWLTTTKCDLELTEEEEKLYFQGAAAPCNPATINSSKKQKININLSLENDEENINEENIEEENEIYIITDNNLGGSKGHSPSSPSYQFVYNRTIHLSTTLQRGLSYLYEWISKHQHQIETSMVAYIIDKFQNQFNLNEDEWCEYLDYFDELTGNTKNITIDKIIAEDNEKLGFTGAAVARNPANRLYNNSSLLFNEEDNEEKDKEKETDKFNSFSRFNMLRKKVSELFPSKDSIITQNIDTNLLSMFKKRLKPMYNTVKPDFMSLIDDKFKTRKLGSLENLSQTEVTMELLFPGSVSKIPLGEDKSKIIKKLFNVRQATDKINKKTINSLFLYKARSNRKKFQMKSMRGVEYHSNAKNIK